MGWPDRYFFEGETGASKHRMCLSSSPLLRVAAQERSRRARYQLPAKRPLWAEVGNTLCLFFKYDLLWAAARNTRRCFSNPTSSLIEGGRDQVCNPVQQTTGWPDKHHRDQYEAEARNTKECVFRIRLPRPSVSTAQPSRPSIRRLFVFGPRDTQSGEKNDCHTYFLYGAG